MIDGMRELIAAWCQRVSRIMYTLSSVSRIHWGYLQCDCLVLWEARLFATAW